MGAPSEYLDLRLTDVDFNPLGKSNGIGVWEVTARYQKRKDPRFTFDTSGGTAHIKQGIATRRYPAPGEVAPDFQGAIESRRRFGERCRYHGSPFSLLRKLITSPMHS